MKKFSLYVVSFVMTLMVGATILSQEVLAEEKAQPSMMDLIKEANYQVIESDKPKSAILIDANTGKFLWG